MSSKIRITSDELRYIALFESVTGATAKDCIIDDKSNRIIFIINSGDIGLAIGHRGANIKLVKNMIGRNVEIVEYADDPTVFIKNSLAPAKINEVRVNEKPDGKKVALVTVSPQDKGIAIGKNGKTAERARFLMKRYFQIDNVVIT
jgi:N utilization substance protein A